jgi:transcriptional regulator with XRE-family HTH domain
MVSAMRPSNQRHPLAVLRVLVGLTQKEMAAILDCSTPTIQAVELGKLKLSEKLAEHISIKTGIKIDWLLQNDVGQPPMDVAGAPYTKQTYENYQAQSSYQHDAFGAVFSTVYCHMANMARLEALILRAFTDDKMPLCAYKLSQAFDKLDQEFGVTFEDHKTVGSPMVIPEEQQWESGLHKFAFKAKRELFARLKRKKHSPYETAIFKQEDIKRNRRQQMPVRYDISTDGQMRPVIASRKSKNVSKARNK